MKDTKSNRSLSRLIYFVGYFFRSLGEVLLFTAKVLGGMGVVVGLSSGFVGAVTLSPAPLLLSIFVVAITSALCAMAAVTGSLVCRIGKKLTPKGAESLLLRDSRNPVLYLRSFVEDRVASSPVTGGYQVDVIHKSLARAFTGDTEEEILARELHRIGPCVAVGVPGERLPPIGAARMYFEDSEWEEGVQTLMRRSELVVMRAGTTRGFLLELEMAVRSVDPRKLIILLPFETEKGHLCEVGRDGYIKFKDAANRILPKELPLFHGSRVSGSSLSGLIHFRSDWTPHFFRFSEVGDTIKESLESISKRYSDYGMI